MSTPTQQFRDLCEKLFSWEPQLTVRYQPGDDDELIAWDPVTQNTFVVWRHTPKDGPAIHTLRWYPSGKGKSRGTFSDFSDDHKHTPRMVPTASCVNYLHGALPVPTSWAWGATKRGNITKAVLFVQDPPVESWIVSADGPTTTEFVLPSKELNLQAFWKAVQAGKLQDLTPVLRQARTVQSAYLKGMNYLVVDGQVLRPQPAWSLRNPPSLAEMQPVAKDLKSLLK